MLSTCVSILIPLTLFSAPRQVTIELQRIPGKSLGFSIAGGRGSTPAYEDVDDSIFITKVAPGGVAEADGRLRLGDKLLSVSVSIVSAILNVYFLAISFASKCTGSDQNFTDGVAHIRTYVHCNTLFTYTRTPLY